MRRSRQQLPAAEAIEILKRGSNGILSLVDVDGEPYGVPLSYALNSDASAIYFHCAKSGRKIDCLTANPRCSFCVVNRDEVMPEEFTSYFRSVIVSGSVGVVSDPAEAREGLLELCRKYSPGVDTAGEFARFGKAVMVLRLDISRISGKEAIELVRRRM